MISGGSFRLFFCFVRFIKQNYSASGCEPSKLSLHYRRVLASAVESGHNGEKYERKRFRKKRKKSKVRHGMVHRKPVCFSQNETT